MDEPDLATLMRAREEERTRRRLERRAAATPVIFYKPTATPYVAENVGPRAAMIVSTTEKPQ